MTDTGFTSWLVEKTITMSLITLHKMAVLPMLIAMSYMTNIVREAFSSLREVGKINRLIHTLYHMKVTTAQGEMAYQARFLVRRGMVEVIRHPQCVLIRIPFLSEALSSIQTQMKFRH